MVLIRFVVGVFTAPVHRGPDVRFPDGRQVVSDPGVSEWRRTLHAS